MPSYSLRVHVSTPTSTVDMTATNANTNGAQHIQIAMSSKIRPSTQANVTNTITASATADLTPGKILGEIKDSKDEMNSVHSTSSASSDSAIRSRASSVAESNASSIKPESSISSARQKGTSAVGRHAGSAHAKNHVGPVHAKAQTRSIHSKSPLPLVTPNSNPAQTPTSSPTPVPNHAQPATRSSSSASALVQSGPVIVRKGGTMIGSADKAGSVIECDGREGDGDEYYAAMTVRWGSMIGMGRR